MNNKEYYQETFSQVHGSREICWEDFEHMAYQKRKRRPLRAAVVLAATLALLAALSATAFALNIFGLRDALLPEKQPASRLDENSVPMPSKTEMVDMLSLSGYMNGPESKALLEWNNFLKGYDVEGAAAAADALARQGKTDPSLGKYSSYQVYNREMADKLEAILNKYGLRVRGEDHAIISRAEWNARLKGDFLGLVEAYAGWMYDDGSFSFDGEISRQGKDEVIDLQFHRAVKGFFGEVLLNIGDAVAYEQWEYKTACGETVLLALGPDKGLVLADFEDCFVTMNILSGFEQVWMPDKGQTPLTRADMEHIADSVNFRLLHPVLPYSQTQGGAPELEETPAPTYTDESGLQLPAALLPVLLGGAGDEGFYNAQTGETMNLQGYRSWRSPQGETELMEFYKIAPIDLDGDGQGEIVLWEKWLEDTEYGCLILREEDGYVTGYPMHFRAFLDLKADGTYGISSGAGDFSVARMHFAGTGVME